jgi:hypothetical protein
MTKNTIGLLHVAKGHYGTNLKGAKSTFVRFGPKADIGREFMSPRPRLEIIAIRASPREAHRSHWQAQWLWLSGNAVNALSAAFCATVR